MIEAEFESDLDNKPYLYDDSHVYDEPSRCLQAQPLPLPPDYKNVPAHPDAPPSYSSTVRFLESAPLANSTMLDSFMSNGGTTSGQREASNYSELNTSEMPQLEYGNIGHSSTTTNTSSELGHTSHDSDAVDYTNVVSHQTEPNPYAELPAGTASNPIHNQAADGKAGHGGSSLDAAACLGSSNQTYDTPVKRQSDYQPLIPGERSSYGEYTQASPCHEHSPYDVPRRQNTSNLVTQQEQQSPGLLTHNEAAGDKEKYVNAKCTAQEFDMYIEMSSAPREK